ncbi:MAG: hypothetical protein JRJ34_07935 [Deltaproteobacteria bacterium]|nr:hypothetical protein [Deltaproteobacteria bacterium]
MKKIPIIPLVIAVVFAIALVIVIASTIVLKKTDLVHENSKTDSVPLLSALKLAKSATKEPFWSGRLPFIPG